MASTSASERIEGAKSLASKDPAKAEQIYRDVLSGGIGKTESASRDYEAALVGLGELYRDNKKAHELAELIKTSRDAFSSFAKAKTGSTTKLTKGCRACSSLCRGGVASSAREENFSIV